MSDNWKKTFVFTRYQYNGLTRSWNRLESGEFVTRSKSPKGVARKARTVVPHINRNTDLVIFDGVYVKNRDVHVCGVWCPIINLLDAYEYTDKPPQVFENVRRNCIRYIMQHN